MESQGEKVFFSALFRELTIRRPVHRFHLEWEEFASTFDVLIIHLSLDLMSLAVWFCGLVQGLAKDFIIKEEAYL